MNDASEQDIIPEQFLNRILAMIQKMEKWGDAHIAIVGAAELDKNLERVLLTKMQPLTREMKDRLFDGYGPLSNFAAKIDVAYALNIISKGIYDDLRTIKRIRIKFAHAREITTLQTPKIAVILAELSDLDDTVPDIRWRYIKRLTEVHLHLEDIYVQHCKATGQTPTDVDISLLS